MISLLIDTCTNNVVIGLVKDNTIIEQIIETNDKSLSTNFIPLVKKIFDNNGLKPNEIDNIFVAVGPGSFTGIRVGVTFAKVMAWTLNKKVIPFSSLELIASTSNNDTIVPLIDARRDYVFSGIYDKNLNVLMEDKYISISDLSKELDDFNNIDFVSLDSFQFSTILPNVDIMKVINKHLNDSGVNPHKLNPNYLKKTEAEENLMVNE